MPRGIADLLSTSSNIDVAFCFLAHLMLIVFPLLVLTFCSRQKDYIIKTKSTKYVYVIAN